VSRATSVSSIAGVNLMRAWPFGALPRSGFDVLRGRLLVVSLPALERLFTATPVGQRHRTRATAQSKSGVCFLKKPFEPSTLPAAPSLPLGLAYQTPP